MKAVALAAVLLWAGAAEAQDWRDRRQWDWGQHDTGSGVAQAIDVPGDGPRWEERDGPVRMADPPAARCRGRC
jgi:hypothetical protein